MKKFGKLLIFRLFEDILKKLQKFWKMLKEKKPKSKKYFFQNFDSSTHECLTAQILYNIDLTP